MNSVLWKEISVRRTRLVTVIVRDIIKGGASVALCVELFPLVLAQAETGLKRR